MRMHFYKDKNIRLNKKKTSQQTSTIGEKLIRFTI